MASAGGASVRDMGAFQWVKSASGARCRPALRAARRGVPAGAMVILVNDCPPPDSRRISSRRPGFVSQSAAAPGPRPARSPARAFLRGLLLVVLAIYFAFAGLVLALRYVVLPRVDNFRGKIEEMTSAAIGLPVRIGGMVADWSGLRPRLHLSEVVVSDKAGLPAETESSQPGFADWLLSQGRIVIRGARLEWTDLQRGAPPLVLDQVNLELRNWIGRHRFGLQARPSAALAATVDVRGDLKGHDPQRPASWGGEIYARVDGADLGAFRAWVDLPYEAAGRGSTRAWVELVEGRLSALTADLRLTDARVRLAPDLPALDLASASGRVRLARSEASRSVELNGFAVTSRQGVTLPATDLRLEQRLGDKPGGSFRANLLDLDALTHLAAHLPLAQEALDRLAAFDPAGRIEKPELEWTGTAEALTGWKLKAGFEGIGLRAWKSIPGVAGLSGEVEGSDSQGRLRIESRNVFLDLPEVFSNPRLQLANLRAEAGWQRRSGGLEFSLDKAEFDNRDASGQASGTYRVTPTGPGVVDLQARLTRADGTAVWRYLPLVVNRETRDWMQHSIVGGTALDARLRLKGDLQNFPFVDGKGGQFQVRARIAGARLDYAAGWPAIDAIDGELLFEGASMKVTADRGRIFGAQLSGVTVVIPDLEAPEEILSIRGRASGPTRDFLRFVTASPVADRIDHFTDGMSAEGNGNLDLEIVMPLERLERTKVKGEFRFAGNRKAIVSALPPVTEAAGRITFTDSSMAVPEARGRLFGEPVQITGTTRRDGVVVFEARGGITPVAARQHWESPIFNHLSGLADWRSTVEVQNGGAAVTVESTLKGLASSLPAPLNKTALDELPMRVDLDLRPGDTGDRIKAAVGNVIAAEVLGRSGPEGWRATRGAIAVHQPVKLPEKGLSFRATLPDLDVDAWRKIGRQTGVTAAAPQRGGVFDLTEVGVQAGKVAAAGETLHDFSIQATARPDGWQGSLKSREAAGDFRWSSKDEGSLTANLSRVIMSGGKEGIGTEESGGSGGTDSLPALDVTVQQFVLGDKAMGRLAVKARNEGRVWRLDSVSLTNPDGGFAGSGLWEPGRNGRTDVAFKVDTSDIGRFLARLGYPGAVKGGKATLEGKLQWAGPPTAIDYPSLSGKMDLNASNGQFQKLEPGVGRLLGVLNLQSLPRRITLDFRDVFSEGFAFDRISGSIDVKAGVMHTSDLLIRGPAARVSLAGSADVAHETQDLLVKIQPTLSESVAVGAAATLLNPVAGVVTYLAQKALADPIEKLFAFQYRITGQWQDPKVEKLSTVPATDKASN